MIGPFLRLKKLPYELANGQLSGEVTEEKSRFYGEFMRGMSQLRDSPASSRRRHLELEKEKKTHAAYQIGEKAAEIERYVEEIMKNSREDILDIQVKEGEFALEVFGNIFENAF